jgi:hypothetical protein
MTCKSNRIPFLKEIADSGLTITPVLLNKNLRLWKVLIDSGQQQSGANTNYRTMLIGRMRVTTACR